MRLEGLVYGRRLVNPAGYGLKIVNGEGIREKEAIPTYHIERTEIVVELV